MMSLFKVLEDLGSEKSRLSESRQKEEQGEFGVTCKPVIPGPSKAVKRINNKAAISPGDIGEFGRVRYCSGSDEAE